MIALASAAALAACLALAGCGGTQAASSAAAPAASEAIYITLSSGCENGRVLILLPDSLNTVMAKDSFLKKKIPEAEGDMPP